MRLGVARRDLTPATPVGLYGFGDRPGPSAGVRLPIEVSAYAFDGALLVCADLLWWGEDLVAALVPRLAEAAGVPADAVFLTATHTHSAPTTSRLHSPRLGEPDDGWLALLGERTLEATREAAASRREVRLVRGRVHARLGVHRRRTRDGVTGFGPDLSRPVDDGVTALGFLDEDGPVALLVHAACHPVVTDDLLVSADIPGAARELLTEWPVVGYLQGCCGDVDPRLIDGAGELRRGDDRDLVDLGALLATAARQAIEHAEPVPAGAPVAATTRVPLPVEAPTTHDLGLLMRRADIWGDWSRDQSVRLDRGDPPAPTVDAVVGGLRLAPGLTLVTVNAEVTTPYATALRARLGHDALVVTCAGGMIGYLCTREQMADGGYEPDESWAWIRRSGRFTPALEHTLLDALERAVRAVRGD